MSIGHIKISWRGGIILPAGSGLAIPDIVDHSPFPLLNLGKCSRSQSWSFSDLFMIYGPENFDVILTADLQGRTI